MKKKVKILTFFLLLILLFPPITLAGRGCCSHHDGQDYCDTSVGKWVCKDGTYSSTCTCFLEQSSTEDNDNLKEELIDNTNQENKKFEQNLLPTLIIEFVCFIIFDKINFKKKQIKNIFLNKFITFLFYIVAFSMVWIWGPFVLGIYGYFILEIISILLIKYSENFIE